MTSESEDKMMSMGSVDSPAAEETSDRENIGSVSRLKKGPWTTAEDKILVEYITKNGEGNWNAVQKHTGLARCGKSCRLRWANHLRPDLKKGAFSEAEERRVIELHSKMGNKWARMAMELPGRTDNEIKNFWNTRIKRQQRAGLPIYPPDICLHEFNENQDIGGPFSSGSTQHHPDHMSVNNNFEIAPPEFKCLELNQQLYPSAFLAMPASSLLDISSSGLLNQGISSSKRFRASEPSFPGYNGGVTACNQYHIDGSDQIGQSLGLSSAYFDNNLPSGSHALLNGNVSSSESTPWATKMELPSFQTHMGNNWGSFSSPLPSLDSVDTLIQSPQTEHTPSGGSLSPRNSGLLDAVLHQSQTIRNSKNYSYHHHHHHHQQQQTSPSGDLINNNSPQDDLVHETEWEASYGGGDPQSPLGYSVASVFNEHTPLSNSRGSSDECQTLLNGIPDFEGCKVEEEVEALDLAPFEPNIKTETSREVIVSRQGDMLLSSNCFSPRMKENGSRESFQAETGNWGTSWSDRFIF